MRGALEYDLLTKGIDLGDLYTGELSIRRLLLLTRHLPHDGAMHSLLRKLRREAGVNSTVRAEDLPPDAYSQTEWLLMALHDQLQILRHTVLSIVSRDRVPPPEFLPRPGQMSKRRKTLNAWFGLAGVPANP